MNLQEEFYYRIDNDNGFDNKKLGDDLISIAKKHLSKQFDVADVSERFSSEGEILQWLYLNTPFAIKPKSKHAKTLLVNPFTSNHAFEKVCKHLANKLYNAR